MKVAFVGGGSHSLLGPLRSVMADARVIGDGEINLYDLNVDRARTMGQLLMKTPEYAVSRPRIVWGTSLEQALEGADAVGVVLMAGSRKSHRMGDLVSRNRGFLSSDNVSPNGAMLAIKGGRILMGIARKMEQHCPEALLIDFANPVAVLSAMVNHHTRIRALGVCAGFPNHRWDLARICGRDEAEPDLVVDVAGVNHLSFILRGTCKDRDLFELLEEKLHPDWKMSSLQSWWGPTWSEIIRDSVTNLVRIYRELGVLIYSTERDGMSHLLPYDEQVEQFRKTTASLTPGQIDRDEDRERATRAEADRRFQEYANQDLDQEFWAEQWRHDLSLRRQDDDIYVQILRGMGAGVPTRIVASAPNCGAVEGFKDRTVLEFTQVISGKTIQPAGRFAIPDVVQGMVSGVAAHQTMLADAIATEDPRLLAHALLAYPEQPYSRAIRLLYRDLFEVNAEEIPAPLAAARALL